MKANSLLSLIAYYEEKIENPSILEVASIVQDILIDLSEADKIFLNPIHYNPSSEKAINLKENDKYFIAKLILNTNWYDITKFENKKKADINYRRKNGGGFSFDAYFMLNDQKRFYINIGIGYKLSSGIIIDTFSKSSNYEYEWYEKIFHALINSINPFFCTISTCDQRSNKLYRAMSVKFPIGYLIYVTSPYNIHFPKNFSDGQLLDFHGGQLLRLENNDFLKDRSTYLEFQKKLKRVIEIIMNSNSKFKKE